jgi:hypothetical protein
VSAVSLPSSIPSSSLSSSSPSTMAISSSLNSHLTSTTIRHHSQQPPTCRHSQQMPNVRSQSLPSVQYQHLSSAQSSSNSSSTARVAIIACNSQRTAPSLQITLTAEENNTQRKATHPSSTESTSSISNASIQHIDHNQLTTSIRSSGYILVGGGSRSAFRPFRKQPTSHSTTQSRQLPNNTIRPLLTISKPTVVQ